jgi:hypothetical protein
MVCSCKLEQYYLQRYLTVSLNPTSHRYFPHVLEQSPMLVPVPKDASGNWIVPTGRPLETFTINSLLALAGLS